ncbi:hypothetical protein P8452_55864 [Trifolium repens]|nr:hypothetical protein P8452_55864 [Trifolium repens]
MEDDTNDSEDSHYIPSDIEAEEAYIEKVVEPKRLRGPTRMQDVWDMDADDIIIVNLDKKDSRVDLNQWRKLVHHWFSEEGQKIKDVNEILRAARQVTNASNAPDQTDSPSSYTDED